MDAQVDCGVLADFDDLERRLRLDESGETAGQLIAYFGTVASSIETLLTTGLSQTEREVTMKLLQGVWAAQRIIQQVWESFHHPVLAR